MSMYEIDVSQEEGSLIIATLSHAQRCIYNKATQEKAGKGWHLFWDRRDHYALAHLVKAVAKLIEAVKDKN